MLTIRPASAADLPAFVHLWNAIWPNFAKDVPELQRDDATLPESMRSVRWLALLGDVPVGFAEAHRPVSHFHLEKWRLDVGVLSDHRKRGIGRALYEAGTDYIAEAGMIGVSTCAREEEPDAVAFAQRRGFSELSRDFESILDLGEVDEVEMKRLAGRVAPVEVVPFAQLDTPAFRRALHEVFEELRHDIPRADPPVRMTFEFFEEQVLEEPFFLTNGTHIALDGESPVGLCGIFEGVNEGSIDQWLTAVRRPYRGRGVAQALKAATTLWAKSEGFRTIRTNNDTRNAPMLAINDQFGFKRCAALITMRRTASL